MLRKLYFAIVLSVLFCETLNAKPSYTELKTEIELNRSHFASQFLKELSSSKREDLLNKAGLDLQKHIINQLATHWYGTEWSFNGTSQQPGKGSIACGYFVTTLLRDVGFNLERAKLAQQASENIIKSLVSKKSIRRYSNKKLNVFLEDVKNWGRGLYIVGLDFHVGFISVEVDGVYFIHSSFYEPSMVIRQPTSESKNLLLSKYRVVGKLEDEQLLKTWFSGAKVQTIGM